MDFFSEALTSPPPCRAAHKTGHGDGTRMTEDTDRDSLRGTSSAGSLAEFQEQHSSSSIDVIGRTVQTLVEKINNSRASNEKVMDNFQEKLVAKVTQTCLLMKEHMYTVYEDNGKEMEVKLQELSEVLESCTKLHNELLEASRALTNLREALAISQVPESK